MTKTFTATVLALSLAITSISTVPAAAKSNDDLGKFLAGAATLFILSQVLEDNNKKKTAPKKAAPVKHPPKKKNHYKKKQHQPQQAKPSRQHFKLPQACSFPIRKRGGGTREVFGKHCLQENARLPRLLPQYCEDNVRIRHGRRATVYDAECLFDRGYRVEARRR